MNANDASPSIDQLLQLPLPAPVSYWPQTWGWAVLLALLLLVAGWAVWRAVRKHRRNRYRRAGLLELDAMRQAAQADPLAARALPVLLKRVGLSAVPPEDRTRVAALTGPGWVAVMVADGGNFAPDADALLRTLAYAPPASVKAIPDAQLQALFAASRQWMEHHHVAA
ncbi:MULTISPECIES: DUF4381 domain-containing protein [Achromobacter]|uniref:DUF4381 domain-containing protein n=1 Tax=Achromobacter spanius TaxID=217203 RepID=A0ABY8GXW1_9BURK|nr:MULTISPECIES: DUF4381 domain-containing protein [Achromobacter]WAI81432.1 DUF4381 domain-containing protein [Achromobacter spanius]WEX96949.1 DUF4381 domain-containing protein [Achromobacter sp. SS2-2022]WFP09334.1 DUF4381 domain-containing protein [Achromobacter spanius]